ncbi:propionate catabolism operon transcriptional regulator [Chitinivorax tropicus]|uniref:Propionate catabolism operon transcriptional regulator n=1 Tax=Chitinivorax tropicus TaxID=714531 RepID=A0A840MTI5_9PROT|nr:propionate catabolism operon regulatory protein PrpR [Chitinivorax tropicus]MBB5020399.1 propionate catabolism operon transcriptional regulator [Chitinivorax tropicus]
MKTKPQLVVVATKGLADLVRSLLGEYAPRADIRLLDKPLEEAASDAIGLQRAGLLDVAIAAGVTAQRLRQALPAPTVMLKVGGYDILQALARARRLSSRIAIVTRQSLAGELDDIKPLLNLEVVQRHYQDDAEARALFHELHDHGVEVVVGSAQVAWMAEQEGLTGVVIYSEASVRQAFDDALEIARIAGIEEAKRERVGNILYSLVEGVAAVDMQGRIQTLNPAMEKLLGISADWAFQQPLAKVAPGLAVDEVLATGQAAMEQVQTVNGRVLVVNRLPIIEQGEQTGAVLTFQDATLIQRADRKLRSQSRHHQFLARYHFADILGESPTLLAAKSLAELYARADATVLITGESGTGKELFAQSIHNAGRRVRGPFVAINCAAFPESLLESELFGYEEGAFTGGRKGGKPGLFESAHTGTLFLDEIGEMPLSLQTRLLRVLQEREVLRLGSNEPTPVDVRVIAATHRDLRQLVAQQAFRADLFYRLNILNLSLPPLRERPDDIPRLAYALARQVLMKLGAKRDPEPMLAPLMPQLVGYAWLGNVRELENLIERIAVFFDAFGSLDQAMMARLAPELLAAESHPTGRRQGQRAALQAALDACGGDHGKAAAQLGISRTTLWRRLKSE